MIAVKTDAELQREVGAELDWDTRVCATDIGVEVREGVVTLSGTARSYAEKVAAQEAAHRIVGVLDVANEIRVQLPGSNVRTDTDIAQAVRTALEWQMFVPSEGIRSTVSAGFVTLTGEVATWHERQVAERCVRGLAGVTGVSNQIVVLPVAVNPRELERQIEAALERRAEREARRIEVRVRDGAVTLSGDVHSLAEKHAVLGTVEHAQGVRSVLDHLAVRPVA